MVYPLSKRFFKLPQLILGITFGAGSLVAYSLQSSEVNISIFILYLGILLWIISFDTIYAMEDVGDDMIIGINSTPIAWGENSVYYSKLLQLLFYVSILLVLIIEEFRLFIISPLGRTASIPNTKSLVEPYFNTFMPPAFVAKFPPMVQLPLAARFIGKILSFS